VHWSHKCQGLELDKVKINISNKEMTPGLSFVAISRVRRLQDILFKPQFPFQRRSSLKTMKGIIQRASEMNRFLSMAIPSNEFENI